MRTKLQAAELILNRSMGKPETYLRVENGEMSREEATAAIMAMFADADDEPEEDASVISREGDSDAACG